MHVHMCHADAMRGWTIFERSVASLVKNMANLLCLSRFDAASMPTLLTIVQVAILAFVKDTL